MKKLLLMICFGSIALGKTYKEPTKLAKDIILNKKKIATLSQKKREAEAQLGVLNTTRELQRVIEDTTREIEELQAQNEMLLLIKYKEGPQLSEVVHLLETSQPAS